MTEQPSTIVQRMRAAADLLDEADLDPTVDQISVSLMYHANDCDEYSTIGFQGSVETTQKLLTILGLEISEKTSWTGANGFRYVQTTTTLDGHRCSITSESAGVTA